jgi:NHL repeat
MRFVPRAAKVAILFGIVAAIGSAQAGTTPGKAPQTAIFVANNFDVAAYPIGASGNTPPIALTTDLALPSGIARDSSGRIYVTNRGSSTVTIFAANANGNVPPVAVIGGSNTQLSNPVGIALDATDKIYVVNASGTSRDSVTIYPPLAAGTGIINEAPVGVISGSKTMLDYPDGIAVDSLGIIYVANQSGGPVVPHQRLDVGKITVYAAGGSGNISPIATISGAATGLSFPLGIALDSAGNIYVTNSNTANTSDKIQSGSSITVYSPGSKGNASPIATIAGSNTGLSDVGGIAIDSSGNLYTEGCANNVCFSINIFPPGSNGNVSPATTISDGLTFPVGVALDSSRNVYVLNTYGGSVPGGGINIFPAGSSGNASPTATIYSNSTGLFGAAGIALDSSGEIYVADPSIGNGGSIKIYPAGSYATGVQPTTTIAGPDTQLSNPRRVAVDSDRDIFALNFNSVTEYPAGSSGDAPIDGYFSIESGGYSSMTGLAVNLGGKLYVTVSAAEKCHHNSCFKTSDGEVVVWPPGSDGNEKPSAVISGPHTSLASPSAIAVDRIGSIYVTNEGPANCTRYCGCVPNGSGSVTVYAPGSSGDAAPIATIGGANTGLKYPYGLSLDSEGNVYVLNSTGIAVGCIGIGKERMAIGNGVPNATAIRSARRHDPLLVFAAGSNGDVAPVASIGGPSTGLYNPEGIAIGPTGQ